MFLLQQGGEDLRRPYFSVPGHELQTVARISAQYCRDMENFLDDLQVASDDLTQLIRDVGGQQLGDRLPVPSPDRGHDVSIPEIPLAGHMDGAHEFVGHARHR